MFKLLRNKRKSFEEEISKVGQYILEKKKTIKIKNKKKFQTNLDIIVNYKIKKIIFKYFNTKKIISEEDRKKLIKNTNYWLIDPIDGTRSLYDGYKTYGIQLCYVVKKKPVYSLINLPEKNKNISSIINDGVKVNGKKFLNNKKKRIQSIVDNKKIPSHDCKKIMKSCNIKNYIEAGSFAYKSMLVALNKATLFVKKVNFCAWDIFPQLLINKELGNFTFDLRGKEFVEINKLYYTNGLIVTSSKKNIKKIIKIFK